MTALVTKYLPLVAGAPDGIKKLRALILELAVCGRLLPAARQPNSDIPIGWLQTKLGSILSFEYGDNLPAAKRSNTGEYPVYGSNGVVGTHNVCFVQHPCIVIGRKGSAGALNLCTSPGCCVTDVAYYCVPPQSMSLEYAFKLLHTLGLDNLGKGIKPGLNRNEAYALDVLVPPLSEQHRIVAKVDELMALCDRLEADQADAAATHAQLVQALLDSLTQATDAADFRASWQRLSEHFHTLLTTEASIDALKQTVLQLAVMGLLSQQIDSDSSASTLLGQIATARTAAASSIKRNVQKPIAPILPQEIPYALPNGWVWTRAEAVSEVIVDCPHSTPKFVPDGVLCLDTNSVKQGALVLSRARYVDQATYDERVARLVPQHGDIVFAREGSVGESMVIPQGMVCCLGQRVMLFRPCLVFPDYFRLALSEPGALARSLALHKGIGAKHVNVADMRNALIPLPPLPEQHRIVAKVDELMALCDQLKAQLVEARAQHSRLADALVAQAVA